jgi:DNA-binding IclR family transcriptional regulator
MPTTRRTSAAGEEFLKRKAGDRGDPGRDQRVVQSLRRGVEVLSYVIEADAPVKLQDIVRRTGLDKASAFRLLGTLEYEGLVAKASTDKTYSIGGRMLRWISSARHDQQIVHLARHHLEKLARDTHESSHLGVLTGTRVTLIDVVPPDALVAIKHSVGSTVELYCSAIGKALLAFLAPELQDRIIAEIEFRRFTGSTIMEPAILRQELESVRRFGYAIDDAEFNDWIYCLAAPILDHRRQAVASLGLSVFKPTLDDDPRRLAFLRAEVCDCASSVSKELGEARPG